MPTYEHVFIARQDVSSQHVDTLLEAFKDVITEGGGQVGKTEYWGLRNLAYRIRKNRKGHYVLMNIDAPHPAVAEMERQMRLHEDILRFMTLRTKEMDEAPSAMMLAKEERGRGRRERPDRGDRRPPREGSEPVGTVRLADKPPAGGSGSPAGGSGSGETATRETVE